MTKRETVILQKVRRRFIEQAARDAGLKAKKPPRGTPVTLARLHSSYSRWRVKRPAQR